MDKKEEAILELAKWLQLTMHMLDPIPPSTDKNFEYREWSALSDFEKHFYVSCIERVLSQRLLVEAVLQAKAEG